MGNNEEGKIGMKNKSTGSTSLTVTLINQWKDRWMTDSFCVPVCLFLSFVIVKLRISACLRISVHKNGRESHVPRWQSMQMVLNIYAQQKRTEASSLWGVKVPDTNLTLPGLCLPRHICRTGDTMSTVSLFSTAPFKWRQKGKKKRKSVRAKFWLHI